jgi:outer membrane murein-binding lipoprotein Lpp
VNWCTADFPKCKTILGSLFREQMFMSSTMSLKIALAAALLIFGGAAAYFEVQFNRVMDERDQLNTTVDQLKANIDQLQASIQQLNAEKTVAEQDARHEAVPELPVSVSFRRAFLGRSMVAEFSSHATTDMAVVVEVVDAATHNRRSLHVEVGPGRPTRLGRLQGLDLEPGDALTMTHDGYKPLSAQVPL